MALPSFTLQEVKEFLQNSEKERWDIGDPFT